MNKAARFFSLFPVILPVIHVQNLEQALRNMQIAFDAGCEGVFLINHNISFFALTIIFEKIRAVFPEKWIGINYLDLPAEEVLEIDIYQQISGVWVDDPQLREIEEDQLAAKSILKQISDKKWGGLYFGSVAFKYQPPVRDLEKITTLARDYMDVITTSGPATGSPPDVEKIKTMKKAAGDKPLAIASGITPENVEQYIPFTDFFLVATGISRSFFEIDPVRLNSLLSKVRK